MDNSYVKHKIVLLGNSGVGKTCIAHRYTKNTFPESSEPTIGASFYTKSLTGPTGKSFQLEIWDTAGQERYRSLTPMYYKGASAALIVYDVGSPNSFEGAKDWIKELHMQAPASVIICLCANKIDAERAISAVTGESLASASSVLFSEVSAKTGENIQRTFESVVKRLPTSVSKPSVTKLARVAPHENRSYCCNY